MPHKREPLEVAAPEYLTDADWVELNRLADIGARDGHEAMVKACKQSAVANVDLYTRILMALDPVKVRKAAWEAMEELGVTEADIRRATEGSAPRGTKLN